MKRSLVICCLLAIVLVACNRSEEIITTQPSDIETAATIQETHANITANGILLPNKQLALSFGASGFVDAVEVDIGEHVVVGQILAWIDSSEVLLALRRSEAELAAAQANYDLLVNGIPAEQGEAVAASNLELFSAQQALDDIYHNAGIQAAQALQIVVNAQEAVENAQRYLDNIVVAAHQTTIDSAYANMILAKDVMDKAEEDYEPWKNKPETNVTRAGLLSRFAQVQQVYNTAVNKYNNLTGEASELDIAKAEADLALAQAQLVSAQARYEILRDGPDSKEIALAEARIALAQAQVALASNNPTPEQLALAQAQVDTARANLDIQQIHKERMTLKAPFDGVISAIDIREGEWVGPGDSAIELLDVTMWRIETKNVGELRIGQVDIGQPVEVTINAFKGKTLSGKVLAISPVAIVQQGDTTYTLSIALEPTDLNLWPGMTARVEIQIEHNP
jgi:HlyD family secretion protein